MTPTPIQNQQHRPLMIGWHDPTLHPTDAAAALRRARRDGYEFGTTLLPTHARAARTDVLEMEDQWWRTSIVGVVAMNEDSNTAATPTQMEEETATTSPDMEVDGDTETVPSSTTTTTTSFWSPLSLEWAWHMNLPAVLLPPLPVQARFPAYATQVATACAQAKSCQSHVWVPVPCSAEGYQRALLLQQWVGPATSRLQFVLDVRLPQEGDENDNGSPNDAGLPARYLELVHWFCSLHVAAIRLDCQQSFLTNKRGYPTLSKPHQVLVMELLKRLGNRNLRVLMQGPVAHHPTTTTTTTTTGTAVQEEPSAQPYFAYLQHLRQKVSPHLDTPIRAMELDYLDALQRPLQPTADHLENGTYETFERDPVKYPAYQRAIQWAVVDKKAAAPQQQTCVVAVVGAGRGPLMTCALHAVTVLEKHQKFAQMIFLCVEKNPSAVLYLHSLATHTELWKQSQVRVIQGDLRTLTREQLGITQPIDIVVSELLGSFGDNEVSPECLDALYRSNNSPDDGVCSPDTVSIPASYTSHLAPVSSLALWQAARQQALYPATDADSSLDLTGWPRAMETTYVVRPHAASQMAPEQDCWTFEHPKKENAASASNERSVELEFQASANAACFGSGYERVDTTLQPYFDAADAATTVPSLPWTLTGFLGTFTAVLYTPVSHSETSPVQPPILLSTAPNQFSVGLFSWFPLYFPVLEPLYVPAGGTVRVHLERHCCPDKVWYEWTAQVLIVVNDNAMVVTATSPVHNVRGRSHHVSL